MIERNDIEKIEDKEWARKATFMSSFRTYLGGAITYNDLIDTFGEPTFTATTLRYTIGRLIVQSRLVMSI